MSLSNLFNQYKAPSFDIYCDALNCNSQTNSGNSNISYELIKDSAGAASVDVELTNFESTTNVGSNYAITLADGSVIGQKKKFTLSAIANATDGFIITPANFLGGSTIELDALNECVELIWMNDGTNTGWVVSALNGATIA